MRFPSALLLFLAGATAAWARPLEVLYFGNEGRVLALFRQAVEKSKYQFLVPKKQEFVGPASITQSVISLPHEVLAECKVDTVLVALIVDQRGKVIDVAVAETSDERISPAVRRDLAEWRFRPAMNAGAPAACLVFVPLSFDFSTDAYPELTELACCHRIEAQAASLTKSSRECLFLHADAAIAARIAKKYNYPWLKSEADFAFEPRSGYCLKADRNFTGTMLSVSHFEKTDAGMKCLMAEYAGPSNSANMRYYFRKSGGLWAVDRVERDPNLSAN